MTEEELEQIIEKVRIDRSKILDLSQIQLTSLPESIESLTDLEELYLENNQLTSLPKSICNLSNLNYVNLTGNPLVDLSILKDLKSLIMVNFFGVDLRCRYWMELSSWESKWLLYEKNVAIREILIREIGYERIYQELGATELDNLRTYTLLKININNKVVYREQECFDPPPSLETFVSQFYFIEEPMVLLKMTCPSTGNIHILRVPPEMTSAEAAITWINHGIHTDKFAVQT